jgi:hypothetical protein
MRAQDVLLRAREAFDRRDWLAARDSFTEIREVQELEGADVFKLADCTWWLGSFREAQSLYEHACDLFAREGEPRQAALAAFAVAGASFMRGEVAAASGRLGPIEAVAALTTGRRPSFQMILLLSTLESRFGLADYGCATQRSPEVVA